MSPLRLLGVTVAAALGGVVNSIAGGGTLVTFPALIALGVPPLVANATSTVALWPGALSSALGYRERLRGYQRWVLGFAVPSVAGGAIGAWLLLRTPESRFELIVPWLVLGATMLFGLQRRVTRGLGTQRHDDDTRAPHQGIGALACQFLVGIYGGYFGAGIGILMLAVLGFMGFSDIHRMNGLKNWGGLSMNFVAAAMFAASGIVDWPVALAMGVGSVAGGYLAARMAQRVPQKLVREAVIVIGIVSGLWLLWAPLS